VEAVEAVGAPEEGPEGGEGPEAGGGALERNGKVGSTADEVISQVSARRRGGAGLQGNRRRGCVQGIQHILCFQCIQCVQ